MSFPTHNIHEESIENADEYQQRGFYSKWFVLLLFCLLGLFCFVLFCSTLLSVLFSSVASYLAR